MTSHHAQQQRPTRLRVRMNHPMTVIAQTHEVTRIMVIPLLRAIHNMMLLPPLASLPAPATRAPVAGINSPARRLGNVSSLHNQSRPNTIEEAIRSPSTTPEE